ncbi:hypothetical protein BGZ94_010144, partial [Podila epigama]
MNKSARKAVNLSVLQRHDSHITDIIDSSSYVVVYKFDEASQSWTKKGVEGTMFVFQRSTFPSYGFFIMNRLGIDNLMADLTADMALQLTSDYIIYRDEKDIHGIWVYEPTDRDRIGEKLLECCKRATDAQQTTSKPVSSTSSGGSNEQHQYPQQPHTQRSLSQSPEVSTMDPLSKMLNEAMSKARVSESSGAPISAHQNQSNHSEYHPSSHSDHLTSSGNTPGKPAFRTLHEIELELAAGSSSSSFAKSSATNAPIQGDGHAPGHGQKHGRGVSQSLSYVDSAIIASSPLIDSSKPVSSSGSSTGTGAGKEEIPSFLKAILSKDKDNEQSNGSQTRSPTTASTSAAPAADPVQALLNSLSGNNRPTNGSVRPISQGTPLSAEFLPASVMPSGLYGSQVPRSTSNGGPAVSAEAKSRPASSTMAPATLVNRPNGMLPHQSPMQAPAFAYSPGMMHSPLAMVAEARGGPGGMQNGVMMHGIPPMNGGSGGGGGGGGGGSHSMPPPPPLPFQHHPGMTPGHHHHHPLGMPMGMPPPPMPGGPGFPADAMHAAMGAVGFMQQRQQAFQGAGPGEVLAKEDFSRRFTELLQNDPEFMDVLYTNYKN